MCRLPFFQKTPPDFESIRWIAQFRDHLECSSFLRPVHISRNGFASTFTSSRWSSSPPQCTDASWMTNLSTRVFNRKRLRLVSNSEINQVYSGVLGRVNWSSCCSLRIDRRLLSHQLFLLMFDHCALLTLLRFQLLQLLRKFFHQIPATYHSTHGDSLVS